MEQDGIKLKRLYQVFEARQPDDGKWYKEWWVEENFPDQYMFISEAPPEELKNPKYVLGHGWQEDDEILTQQLKDENKDLMERLAKLEEMMNDQ